MNKSESIAALSAALSKAQAVMEGAKKDSANPFFKSKYADLASVTEAIRKPLSDNGLSYVQISHEKDDAAAIETVILHESGEWISCGTVVAPVSKADAQGFGSAITYARRYSLQAAFGIAPEDDDGNAAAAAKPQKQAQPKVDYQSLADDYELRLIECSTPEAATRVWKSAESEFKGNTEYLNKVKKLYASTYTALKNKQEAKHESATV